MKAKYGMLRSRLTFIGFIAFQSITAIAGEEEVNALRQELQELKFKYDQLQTRIDELEHRQNVPQLPALEISRPETTSPALAAPENDVAIPKVSIDDKIVSLRKSWGQIKTDLPQERVQELLGPPSKQMLINGKVVWYYVYSGLGAGSVFFKSDKHVSSSQAPNIGWGY
jgi:hypothetical protein